MAFFSTSFTNSYIKAASETNLNRDPGNPINPPPSAFDLGLDPANLSVSNPAPASFTLGLSPPHTTVTNLGTGSFTIGLPAAPTTLSQPSLPSYTSSELKIYNGTTVLMTLGVLISKEEPIQYNYQSYTTVGSTDGTQNFMGDGRKIANTWSYTAKYNGLWTHTARQAFDTALATMTHVGFVVGQRIPCKPDSIPPFVQRTKDGAIVNLSVIPTSIFNTSGGIGT